MSKKRGRQGRTGQKYDRTDRVSGLVREIVASEIERIDDQRLFLLSVTGVDVDRELAHATVWFHVSEDDDDNDGAADDVDSDDNNEFVCTDDDGDSCE